MHLTDHLPETTARLLILYAQFNFIQNDVDHVQLDGANCRAIATTAAVATKNGLAITVRVGII